MSRGLETDQPFPVGAQARPLIRKTCIKKTLLGPVKTHPVCKASGAWAVQTDLQLVSLFFNHFSTFIGIQLSQVSGQCQPGLSSMLKSLYPLSVDDDGMKTDGVTAYECSILFPQD